MSVDRSRLGCALPEAPVPARPKHSTALRGLVAGAALLGGILGSTGAGLSAQFPPPARPPKMAAEPSKPQEGAPAKLPSARSVLDKHLAAIGGRAGRPQPHLDPRHRHDFDACHGRRPVRSRFTGRIRTGPC